VLTVKNTLWVNGFSQRVDELVASSVVSIAEETAPYISMPGEQDVTPSLGLVLQIR
jgi:hypothetical protein